MKRIKLSYLVLALIVSAALFSCKKKSDDDTTSSYLSGSLKFNMPRYVGVGDVYNLTPSGVTHPEGGKVGYYWVVSAYSLRDTVKTLTDPDTVSPSYELEIRDTLGTFTVTCGAYADGYYASVASSTFTVVDPTLGGTLSNTGISAGDPSISDSRDSAVDDANVYYYTTVGSVDWFRNNLAYTGSGIPYEDCPVMSHVFGRYYTWEEAMTACPEGWHLPSLEEWKNLANSISTMAFDTYDKFTGIAGDMMVDARFNDYKMWEFWPAVKITDATGLAMIPTGYATLTGASADFSTIGDYAAFWTSDSVDDTSAWYRYINVNLPDVYLGSGDKSSFAASVRCVRD